MLSVVIPSYNEEKMIGKTAEVMSSILSENGIENELLFINDGSRDNTWEEIKNAADKRANVKGINFSRNFGKEAAIRAGLKNAKGDCVAVIDCDLQHPPEVLAQMYECWKNGFEVVEGIKADRGKESKLHKGFAGLFYGLISKAAGFNMQNTSDFKLLDRKAVDAILSMNESKPFFRALSSWVGFKTARIPFYVQERAEGESKWSAVKLVKYAISNICSFSAAPMQIVTFLGGLSLVLSLVLGIQSLIKKFSGQALEGFTTVILIELIIGSIMMICLGIVGYYIARIFDEIKNRPQFIISDVYCREEKSE